jgi:hypothetical protein
VEKALRARFGVHGFPMFYLVDGWSVYQFENLRSEANLMDFARGGYKKQDVSMERIGVRASIADIYFSSHAVYTLTNIAHSIFPFSYGTDGITARKFHLRGNINNEFL